MAAKVRSIRSTRELSRAVRRSQTAVVKWLKHPTWRFGRGPWSVADIPAIEQWAAQNLAPNPAAGEAIGSPRSGETPQNQVRILQAAHLTLKLKEIQKELHRVDECELRRKRQILAIKNRLLGEVDGLSISPESVDVVRTWLEGILTDFHHGNG